MRRVGMFECCTPGAPPGHFVDHLINGGKAAQVGGRIIEMQFQFQSSNRNVRDVFQAENHLSDCGTGEQRGKVGLDTKRRLRGVERRVKLGLRTRDRRELGPPRFQGNKKKATPLQYATSLRGIVCSDWGGLKGGCSP